MFTEWWAGRQQGPLDSYLGLRKVYWCDEDESLCVNWLELEQAVGKISEQGRGMQDFLCVQQVKNENAKTKVVAEDEKTIDTKIIEIGGNFF
jgi:hypothetical protein